MAKLPDAVSKLQVRISNQPKPAEVQARIDRPVLAQLPIRVQAPQSMEHLDVDEMRGMKVSVLGETFNQATWRLTGHERLEHC